ncbi:MAG: hypothetical protein AAGK97_18780, partial [Bacteroidota bacterium]
MNPQQDVEINQAIRIGSYDYLRLEGNQRSVRIHFENESQSVNNEINSEWQFSIDTLDPQQGTNPVVVVDESNFPFSTTLKVRSEGGCESYQQQEINLMEQDTCIVNFEIFDGMHEQLENEIIFKLNKFPSSFVNNMVWTIDGNRVPFHAFTNSRNFFVLLPKVVNGQYCVRSDIDPNCTSRTCRTLTQNNPTDGLQFNCVSRFKYRIETIQQDILNKVIIE